MDTKGLEVNAAKRTGGTELKQITPETAG